MSTVKVDYATLEKAVNWGLLNDLNYKSFCQTGTMSVKRQDMEWLISKCGGQVHSAIKSTTDYLIVPDIDGFRKGSKYQAAQRNGTVVITEEQFAEMLLPSVTQLLGGSNGGTT